MDPITALTSLHLSAGWMLVIGAAYWLLSCLAHGMPEPTATSSQSYIWFHNFAQLVLANPSFITFPNAPKPQDPKPNA